MRFMCPLVALLALNASCATASKPKETAASSEQNKAEDCEVRQAITGSRVARKTCVTKEQKQREAREAQDILSRYQKSAPVQAGN